ncbi:GNAT family N-acetyltransferase [Halomonas sp. GXIMD04776]|uniref:GNAT family N-acetyltransferase n=1 Tax=Halomonas sp. GXIMD04776 TaxID=3415605 RepID=UPI003CB9EC14
MSHQVRAPVGADVPVLVALTEALGYPCSEPDLHERLSRLSAVPGQVVFVVTDATDCPLGWVHAFEGIQLTSPPFVEIAGLVVDEQAQGQGLGKMLVDAVAAWAKGRNVARLRVHTRICREGAHHFYVRQGFMQMKTQHVFQCELK